MRYLLDVNTLLALGFQKHTFHRRVDDWVAALTLEGTPELATCPITELGFVRVLSQLPNFDISVAEAKTLLAELKRSPKVSFLFFADDHGADKLPPWAEKARQTTDAHLAGLAAAHGMRLATLDEAIPGTLLLPG